MTEAIERFVNSDGVDLWTASEGTGVPVLLCNGGPGCCDYLEPVANLFTPSTQVIRFESRGCGRSDRVPPYNIQTYLSDIENIRHQYRISRWIVGGHSWGADLALIYTLHHPVSVLGLLCLAGGRIHNDREWHQVCRQKRDQGLETLPDYAYPPNLEVNEQVNHSWKQYIQRPTLLKELSMLTVPALFIYGDENIRPSWPVEQVALLLPNAQLVMLNGAKHYLWFTHTQQLRTLLTSFVSNVAER